MSTPAKIAVSFEIETRDGNLFFRASHKSDSKWHGPYAELVELGETIAWCIDEEVIGAWFLTAHHRP